MRKTLHHNIVRYTQLISAYSRFSPLKEEETSKLLPNYGGALVDIATLEKMPGIKLQMKMVQKADVKQM